MVGQRGIGNDRNRRVTGESAFAQLRRDHAGPAHAHVDAQCRFGPSQRAPVHDRITGFPRAFVARRKNHRRSMLAVRERDARHRARRRRRGHAGNDIERDPGFRQSPFFLAAPSKNQRIPAFQPDHPASALGFTDHNFANFRLDGAVLSRALADVDPVGAFRAEFEQCHIGQVVIDHHICLFKSILPTNRDQVDGPWTRSDERHVPPRVIGLLWFFTGHYLIT